MSFPVFLLLIFLFKSDLSKSEADMRSIIISALEKATFFLANKYRDINLDAVFGFHVLQAHLKGALEKWASKHELLSQQARVERLVKKLSFLTEKATHSLGQSDPEYFKEFEPVLGPNFWMLPHLWNQTDSSLAYSMFDSSGCFTEEMSDKCFTYLLGTWKDNGKPCVVTKACRNIMTKFGCSGYPLSHQLFYFMFAAMRLGGLLQRGSAFLNFFCAWGSKKVRASPGDKGLNQQPFAQYPVTTSIFESLGHRFLVVMVGDILVRLLNCGFMSPSVMLCGMSGFSDFYKPSWLENILTWQKPEEGCFGKPSENSEHPCRVKEQEQLLKRVKRREKVFAGKASENIQVLGSP
uniref:Chromosome 16 open reading frame 89 n=1 Tax=Chelonoidis abingdonii TaxID=106734 RepID=A0A8C0JBY2_CHEAB